jgi:hypothetical protein
LPASLSSSNNFEIGSRHFALFVTITVLVVVIGHAYSNRIVPSSNPITLPEKVQAAVAAVHKCTPELRHIGQRMSIDGSRNTVGCGKWIYTAYINEEEQVFDVERFIKWSNHR